MTVAEEVRYEGRMVGGLSEPSELSASACNTTSEGPSIAAEEIRSKSDDTKAVVRSSEELTPSP